MTIRTRLLALGAAAVLGALAVATPAHAAVPDRFGFVLFNGAATVPSGTFPAANTVSILIPGKYKVVFAGQGALGGVVHVTAINSGPIWCQVDAFGQSGADEVAQVSCYKVGGAVDPSAFSAIYDRSSLPAAAAPGQFGYVDAASTGAIMSQFNSAGAVNSATHTGVGQWTVKMPGLATPGPLDGGVQATAINDKPARCKVAKWGSGASGQSIVVLCFDPAGKPFDTRFTLTYQYQRSLYGPANPPKAFGYLWNKPLGGPVSTNFNFTAGPGANTVATAGTGLWLVQFPKIGVSPDDIQVTAFGSGPEFCGLLTAWVHSGGSTVVRDVDCFDNAGAPISVGFFISDSSTV